MIDMHTHILYGVDDGPVMLTDSILMLEKAVEEGITDVISTSHAFHPQFHVDASTVKLNVDELTKEVERLQIPIKIHTGHELRLTDTLPKEITDKKALTLAKTKYILLELPSHGVPAYTTHIIQQLLALELIPIIAHPERNKAIAENPNRLYSLVMNGALSQITSGSLAGHFGKAVQKTAIQLTEANLVHTYGSDMHNMSTRPALFNEGLDYLEKQKQHQLVNILLENNNRLLSNKDMIQLEPLETKKGNIWSIFRK